MRALLVDDEAPARHRLRRLLQAHADVECIGEADSGLEALEKIDQLSPDLVFLDVQMPDMDGLEVAASLREPCPVVIFATAFDAHALRAFELAAVDYLLKPISKERLSASLERARASVNVTSMRAALAGVSPRCRRMAVRSGNKYVVFETDRIAAILAQDHYATILVDDREHLSDDSLDALMQRLDAQQFLRVHRGAILNLGKVRELQQEGDRKYVAVVTGAAGARVPVSREKLEELKARLGVV